MQHGLHDFADMKRSEEDKREDEKRRSNFLSDDGDYPTGLLLTLTHEELAKIGLDHDCAPGDMIFLDCLAKVVSCHHEQDTTTGKTRCRVALQITHMAVEGEDDEGSPEDTECDESMERSAQRYNEMRDR